MSGMMKASVLGLLVLVPVSGAAQSRPNFSGDWVLLSATTSATRGTGEAGTSTAGGEKRIRSNTASGAAFNCGRECSIVHKGQALTIEKALLALQTTPAPVVKLQLDGRQISVVNSFSPDREIPVTAKWNGDKLEITSATGSGTVTQSLAIEAGQLVVVTSVHRHSAQPVTFRYKKK